MTDTTCKSEFSLFLSLYTVSFFLEKTFYNMTCYKYTSVPFDPLFFIPHIDCLQIRAHI